LTGAPRATQLSGMTENSRREAEQRLEAALTERGLADPRPALRERLRSLRETDATAFDQARMRFDAMMHEARGSAADALDPWIEYGRLLGELTGEGKLMSVDPTGRAAAYQQSAVTGCVLLHLPEDPATPALVVLAPLTPSAAQQATLDLLVSRKLSL
jgi:hypothetical protein